MKTTLVISLDEDVTRFVNQQGQADPSAFINRVLREAVSHWPMQPTNQETNKTTESAPTASRKGENTLSGKLELISDLDTPAAD